MNPIFFVYTEFLWRPLFNLLVSLTSLVPGNNMGVAIILVTLVVRLILLPLSLHQARQTQKNQGKMAGLQKEIKKLQEKYKDDKQKKAQATMALYRKEGVNPASGCLPLLIQLPILIALYRVFLTEIGPDSYQFLYSFVSAPETINLMFLGINLTATSVRLAVLAGVMQFIQVRFFSPSPAASPQAMGNEDSAKMMASMQKNMAYIFPAMTIFISLQLPSALALYWVVSILFAVIQQYILKKTMHLSSNPPAV